MAVMSNEATQPYQRIVQGVRGQIRTGQLPAGAKLPSARELAAEYEVALGTVQRALAELRASGIVYSHKGLGSFVTDAAAKNVEDPTFLLIETLQEQIRALTARVEKIEAAGTGETEDDRGRGD